MQTLFLIESKTDKIQSATYRPFRVWVFVQKCACMVCRTLCGISKEGEDHMSTGVPDWPLHKPRAIQPEKTGRRIHPSSVGSKQEARDGKCCRICSAVRSGL